MHMTWDLMYVDPAKVRLIYKDKEIKTHNDAMKAIINQINKK